MKPHKIFITLIAFFLLAKAVSLLTSYYVSITTPSIVEETEKEAKHNRRILSKVGKYIDFETHYNENDFKDSVASFSVKVVGVNKSAILKLEVRKNLYGKWVIVKSDTLYN